MTASLGTDESQGAYMIVTRYEQRVVWEAILAEYRNIGIDV